MLSNVSEKVKLVKGKSGLENDTSITKAESEDEDKQTNKLSFKKGS